MKGILIDHALLINANAMVLSKMVHIVEECCSVVHGISEFMGKTFQAAQLTHKRFLTADHSCNFF